MIAGKPDFLPGPHRFLLYAGVVSMLVGVVSIFGFGVRAVAYKDEVALDYWIMCTVIALTAAVAFTETAMHVDRKIRDRQAA